MCASVSGEGVEMVIEAEAGGGMEAGMEARGGMEAGVEGEMGEGTKVKVEMMEMMGMMEETVRDKGGMAKDRAGGCDHV